MMHLNHDELAICEVALNRHLQTLTGESRLATAALMRKIKTELEFRRTPCAPRQD